MTRHHSDVETAIWHEGDSLRLSDSVQRAYYPLADGDAP